MKRQFVECDDNGVVVEIHSADVKSTKGDKAKEPNTAIVKRKPSHTLHINASANKGDKLIKGMLMRPLPKREG